MQIAFNTISVIGLGYIGLPTAAVLSSRGVNVIGVDTNPLTVDTVNRGHIHIVEPDLERIVQSAVQTGKLRAVMQAEPADVFIIAVPTPFKQNKVPDLRYIEAAATSIAPLLQKNNLVILESTSPVGATEKLARWLAQLRPDLRFPQAGSEEADVQIAYCPERVLPGKVLTELVENDRIVGGITQRCAEAAVKLYRIFVRGECLMTDVRTAEMCKLTENAFRDVNIAFANELSLICDKLSINVWQLIKLANRHPRVSILQPGPGVGGHCIAVDPWFIVDSAPEEAKLIRQAREVNDNKPLWVIKKVKEAVAKLDKYKPVIACLGLAFKADIDDVRESPAMWIVHQMTALQLGQVIVVEPNLHLRSVLLPIAVQVVDLDVALKKADIVLLLVDHKQFRLISRSRHQLFIDTRGLWSA